MVTMGSHMTAWRTRINTMLSLPCIVISDIILGTRHMDPGSYSGHLHSITCILHLRLPGGGGTRVHHGRVGSAGLCDLKILHPWRRLKKGVKILQWPPNARKGGSIFYISMKSLQKRGSKIYNSKKYRGQNSTSLKMGVKILHAEK